MGASVLGKNNMNLSIVRNHFGLHQFIHNSDISFTCGIWHISLSHKTGVLLMCQKTPKGYPGLEAISLGIPIQLCDVS